MELTEDGVLVIRRVLVRYRLRLDAEPDEATRGKIDRAMEFHPRKCPVARTLWGCVEISTELEVVV